MTRFGGYELHLYFSTPIKEYVPNLPWSIFDEINV